LTPWQLNEYALLKPVGQSIQVACKGRELPNGLRVTISGDRNIEFARPNINSGGIRVPHRQFITSSL
jgi:hypothetical protein